MKQLAGQGYGSIWVVGIYLTLVVAAVNLLAATAHEPEQIIRIDQKRQLFVAHHLIERLEDVNLHLHEPRPLPLPRNPLPISYTTVIKDGGRFRAYYRDYSVGYSGSLSDGNPGEITCYAESVDGNEWTFPDLNITEVQGSRGRNVILANAAPCSHNFSPFLDSNPEAEKGSRFKALAGTHPGGGLYAFGSSDGINWKKIRERPVIVSSDFAFDSQNVAFWSEEEECYVCYFRTWQTLHGRLRTISRTTSKDFLNWSSPIAMNPNLPGEHLYTSQTHPYFRAPHIYIALPTRFMPDRGESTDILFMTARAGSVRYDRTFKQAFIRPGLDPDRWGNRSNYVALNVVPTEPGEMSIYHKDGRRHVLRVDGFVSVRAGHLKGELLTKPFIFSGNSLTLNYSTSAAGSLQVEVQEAGGVPIAGFDLEECALMIGDEIEGAVQWMSSPDAGKLAGIPVRLRFVMKECDLYSFQFRFRQQVH